MSFIFLQSLDGDEWVSKHHLVSLSIHKDIVDTPTGKLDVHGNPLTEQTPIHRLYAKDVNGEEYILFEHADKNPNNMNSGNI